MPRPDLTPVYVANIGLAYERRLARVCTCRYQGWFVKRISQCSMDSASAGLYALHVKFGKKMRYAPILVPPELLLIYCYGLTLDRRDMTLTLPAQQKIESRFYREAQPDPLIVHSVA